MPTWAWRTAFDNVARPLFVRITQIAAAVSVRRRGAIAVALSLALHIIFMLALLPHARPGISTGGQGGVDLGEGEGEGLNLDLSTIALPDALVVELREPEPETLATLDKPETLDAPMSETEIQPVGDALAWGPSLSQPVTTQQAASRPAHASAARQGGEGQSGTSSGTFDDLWAAIAPCWRRISDGETLPVNLTVSFAGNGMLAKPPEILRNAEDASDAKVLRSENLAITALAECGAYQMAAGRENVSIHFPKP